MELLLQGPVPHSQNIEMSTASRLSSKRRFGTRFGHMGGRRLKLLRKCLKSLSLQQLIRLSDDLSPDLAQWTLARKQIAMGGFRKERMADAVLSHLSLFFSTYLG